MKIDPVKRIIWDDIIRGLEKETDVEFCRCYGDEFYSYLVEHGNLPFLLKKNLEDEGDSGCDLIVGWQMVGEDSSAVEPEVIFRLLKEDGEALLYGHYSDPRPEDILEWDLRCRREGSPISTELPFAGAISLGRISTWLKESPFDRYTVRKKGIYYQAWLRK